jgi:hypothetical protein
MLLEWRVTVSVYLSLVPPAGLCGAHAYSSSPNDDSSPAPYAYHCHAVVVIPIVKLR